MGERTIRTRYKFRFKADLGDWLGQHIFLTGAYEPPTAKVIEAIVSSGDTFIDAGANAGFFTLLGSRQVGPKGKVIAFEPLPSMRERIKAGMKLNSVENVSLEALALSDQQGTVLLHEGPDGHKGISSLRKIDQSVGAVAVKTAPLDSFESGLDGLKLIKIDVEGAEQLVLNGMQRIIQRYHPFIVIEVTNEYLSAFGHDAVQLAQTLTSAGYRMFEISADGLVPMEEMQAGTIKQFNALFAYQPVPATLLAPLHQE
ncbi:MAG: FkbM family methyltransferase [Pseudomonadota bacterium]